MLYFEFQDVLDVWLGGKTKNKQHKKMRVFLFENVVIFSETIKREGQLPLYKCVANGKVSVK